MRVAGGPWMLVLPNCDAEGARDLVRRALGGLEPPAGMAGVACCEDTQGESLLEVALAGMQTVRAAAAAPAPAKDRAAR